MKNYGMTKLFLALGLCLVPLLASASPTAEKLKADAMRGDKKAIISLTDAYFHGGVVAGISKNLSRSFVWGTVYMELDPNFGQGIERVTIFSEQELFAEGMTDQEHAALLKEAQQLARQIRAKSKG
jgi:hypothetical protein